MFKYMNSLLQGACNVELPDGWEWIDDWKVDTRSTVKADGWVYAPDTELLKWPESSEHLNSGNSARQRKWIRHRKYVPYKETKQMSVGLLKPGDTVSLPLPGLSNPVLSYILQLRPNNTKDEKEYCWSAVLERRNRTEMSEKDLDLQDICVSALNESDVLLFCSQSEGASSHQGVWFSVSIQAKEIGKDINSVPIYDWNLKIDSPLALVNYLPLPTEYTLFAKQLSGEQITCSRGNLEPGETVKIYSADLRDSLYMSLLPEGGWQLMHVS